jgi:hypothetical protein
MKIFNFVKKLTVINYILIIIAFCLILTLSVLGFQRYKAEKGSNEKAGLTEESVKGVRGSNNEDLESSPNNADAFVGEEKMSESGVTPSTGVSSVSPTTAPTTTISDPVTAEDDTFDRAAYCLALWNKQQDAVYGTKSAITQTQNKIYNLMSDIRGRTSGSFVTEAQIQAMYVQEKAVLDTQLRSLNEELQRIKAENPTC